MRPSPSKGVSKQMSLAPESMQNAKVAQAPSDPFFGDDTDPTDLSKCHYESASGGHTFHSQQTNMKT